MPRINFVSFTFLFAFGLGAFAGLALALLAVALARPEDETTVIEPVVAQAVTATPRPSATATEAPTATVTPVPPPRTLSTLQVRIGPHQQYAVLGTLARGNEVDVQGRDDSGDWLAIEFPPGSAARGWIPADAVGSLTLVQVLRLDVLQASLIETAPATSTPGLFQGNDGVVEDDDGQPGVATPTRTPLARTPSPTVTPTQAVSFGPTDLALAGVSVASDGRVSVAVANEGSGNVASVSVQVSPVGFAAELIGSGVLLSGETTVLLTSRVQLTEVTEVTVTLDPSGTLPDVDPTNNTVTLTLTP
jgi:hypothetical protein